MTVSVAKKSSAVGCVPLGETSVSFQGQGEWFEGGKCLALMLVARFQAPRFITVV